MKAREALIAVMRKMLMIASRLMKTGEMYDPTEHIPSSEKLALQGLDKFYGFFA
ncbi:MAG: hypothetical protein NVSMB49_10090 [Ktedonobacteraceae bacterium]